MRALLILALAACPLAFSHTTFAHPADHERNSFRQSCERMVSEGMQVQVSTSAVTPTIVRSVASRVLLTKYANGHAGDLVPALSQTSTSLDTVVGGVIHLSPDQREECLVPRLQIALVPTEAKIFIAREISADSCPDRELLRHERQHMALYVEALQKSTRDLQAALRAELRQVSTVAPKGTSVARLEAELDSRLKDLVGGLLQRHEAGHAEIDSPDSYMLLARSCGGETMATLVRYR